MIKIVDENINEQVKDAIKTIGRNIIDKVDDISRDIEKVREINITATLTYDMIPTIDVTKSYILNEEYADTTNTQILDDVEKEYLEGIIKPFKNKVLNITKRFHIHNEFIGICVQNDADILLPSFEYGTMYRGMETDKHYTLEELGLFK